MYEIFWNGKDYLCFKIKFINKNNTEDNQYKTWKVEK